MLYDQLKIVKEGLLGAHGGQAAVFVKEIAQSFQAETQNKKTAELLTREEERLRRKAGDLLEAYAQKLAKAGTQSAEQAMTLIKEWFDARQDELERQQGDAGQMLEHAFDFLEAAFGAGQEMVIFITELNNDYYSVRFLQNCECERYYRYNKELLFEESSRAIEARLRAMGR